MSPVSDIGGLATAVQKLGAGLRENAEHLKRFDSLKEAAEAENSALDTLEDKLAVTAAIAAAGSGTPEEARALASKMRAKAMRAAANGADTGALESMVREMERLARIAQDNRDREKRGGNDASASAIPALAAVART